MPILVEMEKAMEDVLLTEKSDSNKGILEKLLGEISKTTRTKQMLIGVSSGWVGGFVAMRIGRTTAMALGGGIILLQIASDKGFIKINWDKVNERIDKVEELASPEKMTYVDKVVKFAEKNTTFSSGFLGGFLIGLGSH